jgi:hypothetical protein
MGQKVHYGPRIHEPQINYSTATPYPPKIVILSEGSHPFEPPQNRHPERRLASLRAAAEEPLPSTRNNLAPNRRLVLCDVCVNRHPERSAAEPKDLPPSQHHRSCPPLSTTELHGETIKLVPPKTTTHPKTVILSEGSRLCGPQPRSLSRAPETTLHPTGVLFSVVFV